MYLAGVLLAQEWSFVSHLGEILAIPGAQRLSIEQKPREGPYEPSLVSSVGFFFFCDTLTALAPITFPPPSYL